MEEKNLIDTVENKGKKKNFRIIRIIIGLVIFAVLLFIANAVLFTNPPLEELEIDVSDIKYVEVEYYNKTKKYIFEESEDINKVITYLNSLDYRKYNNYEKIEIQKNNGKGYLGYSPYYEINIVLDEAGKEREVLMKIQAANEFIYNDERNKIVNKDNAYETLNDLVKDANIYIDEEE